MTKGNSRWGKLLTIRNRPIAGRHDNSDRAATKVYLVGGGIAALAAAVFLIRDGDVLGRNITILEELEKLGGSLDYIDESKWVSFTTTQHDPSFFGIVRDATGNVPGEGGLVTFMDSAWLMSIVLPHQPHFIGQPDDVKVFWGYGLFVDKPGDFVKKPMSMCSGREIMTELLGHLRVEEDANRILGTSTCIPCMMPFITSQFLRRELGDRPQVVPDGSTNLGFIGQFCEIPDDVVFTVEYSVRSAQTAVYSLLGLNREPPAVYKGQHDLRVLYGAFMTLHGIDP